jgi:DNA repair protein RecO (recombination protein O)
MLVKTEAIVLRSIKYGESRLIIDLFTREVGRLSCIVNIPKTGRGRLKKQLFQPLSLIDLECDVRPKVQLQKMRDARMLYPYSSIPFEPGKMAIVMFLAEFLYHALRSEQQAEGPLFDYMSNSFRWFDAADEGYANFHLAFLMHLSNFLGFAPLLSSQGDGCSYFDLREGVFCEVPPLHTDFLQPEESARIRTMMRMDYPTMHLFQMSRTDRNRCLDVVLTYYGLHLPSFPDMKSLPVLQELFV